LPARLVQGGVATAAVEQWAADIGLEIGDGDADGGLAFTQLARCCGERTQRCGFDKAFIFREICNG